MKYIVEDVHYKNLTLIVVLMDSYLWILLITLECTRSDLCAFIVRLLDDL